MSDSRLGMPLIWLYAGNTNPSFYLAVVWFEMALDKFDEEQGSQWALESEYKTEIIKQFKGTVKKVGTFFTPRFFVIVVKIFSATFSARPLLFPIYLDGRNGPLFCGLDPRRVWGTSTRQRGKVPG